MRSKTIYRVVIILLAFGLLAGACSKDTEVGSGLGPVKPGDKSGSAGIRDPSSTTSPPTTQGTSKTTAPPATSKPTTPPPTQPEKKCTQVKAGDGSIQDYILIGIASTPYNPRSAGFRQGALVCWKNTDSVAHSIDASNGAFSSGAIAPGGIFKWTANVSAGRVNYADPDRPFAVGELNIQ